MKKLLLSFFPCAILTIFILMPLAATAQNEPAASPQARVEQVVGTQPIMIEYSSPGVKGRVIWGDLVPYGQIWRAGANAKTVIEFSESVSIDGVSLEAGRYGFQLFPEKDEWDLVFSNTPTGSSQQHEPANDVARIKITPKAAPFRERLAYSFDNMTDTSCTITLHWEKLAGTFEVILGGGDPAFTGDAADVYSVVDTALKHVQALDPDSMLKAFADDFSSDQGGGRSEYREFLTGAIEQGFLDDMKIDMSETKIELENNEASVEGITLSGAFGELNMDFKLVKRDGKWLVTYSAQY